MSFDIARTPTLHAVATGDDQQLIEDLQQRVEAAFGKPKKRPRSLKRLNRNARQSSIL